MNPTHITAAITDLPEGKAPSEIVYIPEGTHKIRPLSNPEGVDINLSSSNGNTVAAALNQKLQERRAQAVQPWFDFEHTRKAPASGYPTAFRYEPGKGIMASVEWSASGRKAIEGRDVRYFSPEFYIDENGVPSGLPGKGPVGGLVSEPAFREIGPIAAAEATEEESDDESEREYLEFEKNREAEEERLVAASEKIREDTRKKLETLAELGGEDPWSKLYRIALEIVDQYPETDEKEAFRQACLDNPELYQEWQDSRAEPSKVPEVSG